MISIAYIFGFVKEVYCNLFRKLDIKKDENRSFVRKGGSHPRNVFCCGSYEAFSAELEPQYEYCIRSFSANSLVGLAPRNFRALHKKQVRFFIAAPNNFFASYLLLTVFHRS